ncbi:hypothetical protein D9758_012768 [Tetrapyrgos nigripes]|uniref:Transposase n=1 Tax=Tetrapyrgos nigripes TaxID=182062 RepID=A0A8H5CR87_9AGAR|nr:hypothetical protein D9758_012768 [Tetrapyrgos nigripes]
MIQWWKEEKPISKIAKLAGCTERTVYALLSLYRTTGEVINLSALPYSHPRLLTLEDRAYIQGILDANPALYLDEIQDKLWDDREVDVSLATLSRALMQMAVTNKKISNQAAQHNALLEATWIGEFGSIPKEYIVWLDESGVDTGDHMQVNGWAPLGHACRRRAIFTLRRQRYSILPALTCDGIMAKRVQRAEQGLRPTGCRCCFADSEMNCIRGKYLLKGTDIYK